MKWALFSQAFEQYIRIESLVKLPRKLWFMNLKCLFSLIQPHKIVLYIRYCHFYSFLFLLHRGIVMLHHSLTSHEDGCKSISIWILFITSLVFIILGEMFYLIYTSLLWLSYENCLNLFYSLMSLRSQIILGTFHKIKRQRILYSTLPKMIAIHKK